MMTLERTETNYSRKHGADFDPSEYESRGEAFADWEVEADGTTNKVVSVRAHLPHHQSRVQEVYVNHETNRGPWTHSCCHCGASCLYGFIFEHKPSGDWIFVGRDCGAAFEFESRYAHDEAMRRRTAERLAQAVKVVRENQEMHGQATLDRLAAYKGTNDFIRDIASKVLRYTLSERQVGAAMAAMDREEERQRQQEADAETAMPAEEGRVEIVGKILTIREQPTQFGYSIKTLLRVEKGEKHYKVWATLPGAIDNAERGDRVRMTVTLTRSDDDPCFAFGKRPSKASIVERIDH